MRQTERLSKLDELDQIIRGLRQLYVCLRDTKDVLDIIETITGTATEKKGVISALASDGNNMITHAKQLLDEIDWVYEEE